MERSRYSDRGGRDDRDDSRDRDRDRGRDDRDEGRSSRDSRDDRGDDRGRGGSRYTYEKRDSKETKSRSEGGPGDYDVWLDDSLKLFKADKANTIRIVPPTWKGAKHYGYDVYMHFGVGPDRQSYLCPNKMETDVMAYAERIEKTDRNLAAALREHRGKCPICEERETAVADGDDKLAKDLAPKKRVVVYLIDRNKPKDGLMVWAMPWTVDRDVCAISVDRKTGEALPIDHPEEGFDVFFDKKGEKDRTEYLGLQLDRRDSDLGDPKWLQQAMENPVPDQLIFYPYDHIAKAFGGGGSQRGSSRGREDDKPARSRDDDRRPSRDDDRRPARDDDRGGSSRSRPDPRDSLTWESVHRLEGTALDKLVDEHRLKLKPNDYKSDEELADAICAELDLRDSKHDDDRRPARDDRDRGSSSRGRDEPDPRDRLREMREERERKDRGDDDRRRERD